jgi:hypothetical protein
MRTRLRTGLILLLVLLTLLFVAIQGLKQRMDSVEQELNKRLK